MALWDWPLGTLWRSLRPGPMEGGGSPLARSANEAPTALVRARARPCRGGGDKDVAQEHPRRYRLWVLLGPRVFLDLLTGLHRDLSGVGRARRRECLGRRVRDRGRDRQGVASRPSPRFGSRAKALSTRSGFPEAIDGGDHECGDTSFDRPCRAVSAIAAAPANTRQGSLPPGRGAALLMGGSLTTTARSAPPCPRAPSPARRAPLPPGPAPLLLPLAPRYGVAVDAPRGGARTIAAARRP